MTWEKATDALREEHEAVKKVVASMAVLLIKLETGKEVDPETVEKVVGFMKLAGDLHERKEETLLFPALEQRGVSTSLAPVRMLVHNHQRARAAISRMAEAASANSAGWFPMDSPLIESLQELTDLYPPHFWQEDMLVYRMADRTLNEDDNRKLIESFQEFDARVQSDAHSRLLEMANTIDSAVW